MKRDARIAAIALGSASAGVLSAALLCTWAVAEGASMRWRLPFRALCHGIIARCLILWGAPMPICARCSAIYAGLVIGSLLFAATWRWIEPRAMRALLLVAALPIAVDGITQAFRLRESTNTLRLATGFPVAVMFALWLLATIERGRMEMKSEV
jgi:uncharacterized membrane protein